jgi:putative redox protein
MKMEISFEGKKGVNASFNGFVVKTDQPVDNGGGGTAPEPFNLFLASIGTCTGIYIKSFCDNRNIPTEGIKIFQETETDEATQMVTKINIEIQVPADFPENYRDALVHVAGKCKVKKHIMQAPEITAYTKVIE